MTAAKEKYSCQLDGFDYCGWHGKKKQRWVRAQSLYSLSNEAEQAHEEGNALVANMFVHSPRRSGAKTDGSPALNDDEEKAKKGIRNVLAEGMQ